MELPQDNSTVAGIFDEIPAIKIRRQECSNLIREFNQSEGMNQMTSIYCLPLANFTFFKHAIKKKMIMEFWNQLQKKTR